ncbi:MAG: hypothetical protein IKD23_03665 [Lentisphaeria bacterium]|nr:hypothetical protein [Lentisphaeria bacterium]
MKFSRRKSTLFDFLLREAEARTINSLRAFFTASRSLVMQTFLHDIAYGRWCRLSHIHAIYRSNCDNGAVR